MECHCGRCYGHFIMLTDVVPRGCGRWNSHCERCYTYVKQKLAVMTNVTDGMATGIRVVYYNLSSGVLSRTSSHTCGKWYCQCSW